MKKFTALLLAWLLLMGCAAALAQAAPAATPISFGDFSMTLDPNMAGQLGDKTENGILMTLYPAYNEIGDSSTNFNSVWNSTITDIGAWTQQDMTSYFNTVNGQLASAYQEQNLVLKDFSISGSTFREIDGLTALVYTMVSTVDFSGYGEQYKGMVLQMYQLQAVVSGKFGTYTFTGTAQSEELLHTYVDPLLDLITWN
ncbi:MAG: hypothetical protein IJ189_11010 [Clostridia bacterium]|nr:hypothetical protein [Clostridia bacterium]